MDITEQLEKGKMIVVYDGDGREGEADLVFGAKFATPEKIEILRKEAGGLICTAIDCEDSGKINLPFFTDLIEASSWKAMSCRKTAYGDRPAFSLPVNHCMVYTGITDEDRSLTIRKLDETVNKNMEGFEREFYTPGHVFLLIGRGIKNRKGHTELALELGKKAGLKTMVLCEMLGKGKALSKEKAREYAEKNGLGFVEGKEVFE
ncbi:3,4-dihydroxy-2-butanone-4-phosphate synthase [Candidatus Micrarchaeota archaeon]|nr:3,4-dihydroxy-2-butanone-4-phosphate synthase [Candidatus Micrarchaeota archaeon]